MCSLHARRVDTTFTSLFPFPSLPSLPSLYYHHQHRHQHQHQTHHHQHQHQQQQQQQQQQHLQKKKRFSPPVRSGLLVYIRALLLLLLLLLRRFRCFLNCGPCRASTASSVGRQLQARDRFGACRNSTASSRSLAALPQVKGTTQWRDWSSEGQTQWQCFPSCDACWG